MSRGCCLAPGALHLTDTKYRQGHGAIIHDFTAETLNWSDCCGRFDFWALLFDDTSMMPEN